MRKQLYNTAKNMQQYKWLILTGIVVIIAIVMGVSEINKFEEPICPDDFKDPKQEIASFTKWVEEFAEKYPNATNSDLSKARRDFYVENNCTEALKRYDDFLAGNVDEKTNNLVETVARQELSKKQRELICPNEYASQEDYVNAVGQWASDYYRANPNATKDEVLAARKDYMAEHGCE